MADLKDGESVEVQGSGARPYVLRNLGGVYSCSCPAWRNQSLAIEKRSCKHLRKLRGDEAEKERVGDALPDRAKKEKSNQDAPPLLLAHPWDNAQDPDGWWMSEKLDGVRAYWDGKNMLSRQGNLFHTPEWFVEQFPTMPLDGELWLDRHQFQRTVSIVRRQDKSEHWRRVRYLVFDAPACAEDFEGRLELLQGCLSGAERAYLQLHQHRRCQGLDDLREELARVEALGGEGLMMRQPHSKYEVGRSMTLLKVKTFHDAEAVVVGHQAGRGRHRGRLGALQVELADGTSFKVGTGLTDAQRAAPPALGSTITFRYQELSDAGVPRFPSFVRLCPDQAKPPSGIDQDPKSKPAPSESPPDLAVPGTDKRLRHFEFHDQKSDKFWEISALDCVVEVRYGRIGSKGQTKTKSFDDPASASRHAAKLIAQKTAKGYREEGAVSD